VCRIPLQRQSLIRSPWLAPKSTSRNQRFGRSQHSMKKVIVFRNDLLPISETFIKEQILALTDWKPVLTGYRIVENGLALEGLDIRLLPGTGGKLQRLYLRFCQWLGLAHGPSVRTLRKLNADLVHIHFGTDAVDIWPSLRRLKLPVVVTLHGYDINTYPQWWQAGYGGWRRRFYPRRLLKLAQDPNVRFIAVSGAMRARAIEYGIPAYKIAVRYIGIDAHLFQPELPSIVQRPNRILFVGRLVEKKGVPYLIRAFARLRDQVPDAELTIVGDGPMRSELEMLSAELDVPTVFSGALSDVAVRNEMKLARILCLPSIRAVNGDAEGFGMVLLEAQAAGIPVVTSAFGGAQEGISDRVTGFGFTERDEVALCNYLRLLLSDSTILKSMSDAAPEFVRLNFDLGKLTKKLETYYDNVSERRANG
jgi:glycosyltransferase involved in cell wall biosynthesis